MDRFQRESQATSAWRETADRFPVDRRLRRLGFSILSRPRRGPVLWRRRKVYCEMRALALADVLEERAV
jgi:hypothetical protein